MSPEQLAGKPLTLVTDIYSLGLVLYEMITGVKPFGESFWMNLLRRLTEDPLEPAQHVSALDRRWNHGSLRCLSRDPEDRFRSTSEITACLTGLAAEHQHGIRMNETVIPQDCGKHHSPFRSVQLFEPEATVHPGLTAVGSNALAKNPETLYQTGAELTKDLENCKVVGSNQNANASAGMQVLAQPGQKTAAVTNAKGLLT